MSANVGFDDKSVYYLCEFKGTDFVSAFLLQILMINLKVLRL